jgi:hypothetical protein
MQFKKTALIEFLGLVDEELDKPIDLIAVGGTAMTLLNLKASTRDIDFNLSGNDVEMFNKVLAQIPHGFEIHIYADGLIFSQQLPDDFIKKCIAIETKCIKIKLFALHPIDIVVSKIGRLNSRDLQDIETCIKKSKLTRAQIEKRGEQVEYVGKEENYRNNLRSIIERFFKNNPK